MKDMINDYIKKNYEALLDLLRSLAVIPAPSGKEAKRAEFCLNYLKSIGATDAYIDDAKNVIFPLNCNNSECYTVFSAHTDTVFPDTQKMSFHEDEEKMYCPGVGDDTASVCVLLFAIKFLLENNISFNSGILFVLNSCEEGLGNLKGTKALMKKFPRKISSFVAFDSKIGTIYDRCVGSHRYEIEVKTTGGHSFHSFGSPNAIAEISGIISDIYKLEVPVIDNSKTTYNVGISSGGTSVNTIAQSAKMLCEYRSDNSQCLDIMKERFNEIFSKAQKDDVSIFVEKIGDRPCENNVNKEKKDALTVLCNEVLKSVTGNDATIKSASTDCNIPLSMGIPAICTGVFSGGGAHTREEWIYKESLKTGLEIAIKIILAIKKEVF